MHDNDTTHPTFITLGPKAKDITGQRFHRLVVLGPIEKVKRGIKWLCLCDCGNTTIVLKGSLTSGNTKACGCLMREHQTFGAFTHNLSDSPLYGIWGNMITRCTNPNVATYANYGARGISVCAEFHDFQTFHDHVTQLPNYGAEGYTLDRIDNDANYEPGNMRWASPTTQNRNRRNNRLLTYNGKTQCLSAWAEELNLHYKTLLARLCHGWPVEKALTPAKYVKKS